MGLRLQIHPYVLSEIMPSRWSDFIRNAPVDKMDWGTRASPQARQPFAAPPGQGPPLNSYRSGSAKALYFGSVPGGQLQPDARQLQQPDADGGGIGGGSGGEPSI